MYTASDIRVGSYVKATGRVGDTLYRVVQVDTRLGGDNSFLGADINEHDTIQIVSCSSIKSVICY